MVDILDFIHRRFTQDCDWITGNCYYFSVILKDRFPGGTILYDVINGHFVYRYTKRYFDWTGEIVPDGYLVEWDNFDEYDEFQRERIIRDCIQ